VLCNGDEEDTDHKCHWFISSKDCYKSNGKVLGPVDNWNCRQGIKDKEVEAKLNAEYISKFKSCRDNVQNMSFMPKVCATADEENKKMGLDLILSSYLENLTGLVNSNGPDEGVTFNNELVAAYCFIKALESDVPKTRQARNGNILQNQFKNSKSGIPISDLKKLLMLTETDDGSVSKDVMAFIVDVSNLVASLSHPKLEDVNVRSVVNADGQYNFSTFNPIMKNKVTKKQESSFSVSLQKELKRCNEEPSHLIKMMTSLSNTN
jgi:hypothetical protein